MVPITFSFDTAGPMTRSVRDAAILMDIMSKPNQEESLAKGLGGDFLQGRRIGVMRFAVGTNAGVAALFEDALQALKAEGAILVEIEAFHPPKEWRKSAKLVAGAEFDFTLNKYLAGTDLGKVSVRNLDDLIRFNQQTPREALWLFDQARIEGAAAGPNVDDAKYQESLALVRRFAREDGIDAMLREHEVELLVAPSRGPAPMIDIIYGDQAHGSVGAGYLAATAGYPNLTVPMGFLNGLPIGLDFMGPSGSDGQVLAAGFDFEQATHHIRAPTYLPGVMSVPAIKEVTEGIAPGRSAVTSSRKSGLVELEKDTAR